NALFSGGQVTSLFITPLGEAYARRLVGDRLKTINAVAIVYVVLPTDRWMSESELFRENLIGDPETWNDATELVLPLLTSGLIESSSDNVGRVGYRRTSKELPDEPEIDVAVDESMDSIYVRSFNEERKSLQQCEPLDNNEVFIPLSASLLQVATNG
ncbi:MAG: hypothetical protein ACK56W_02400, partial [Pirellula sp.]|nr:hypothetical protein [Pirellula sp.]